MAYNEEDAEISGGSFSQLLFAADGLGLDSDGCYHYTSSSPQSPPKMLCFGDNLSEYEITRTAQKSGVTSSASSSTTNTLSKLNKKRNESGKESIQSFIAGIRAPVDNQTNCKRGKSENTRVRGHVKAKKEKLGERITELQRLVSPYGKTDTTSVLHEAMGYIRFLQEQIQVLCSPYLKSHPSSLHLHHQELGRPLLAKKF